MTFFPAEAITLGESMAAFIPIEAGPLRSSHRFRLSTGGAEANVAIGLARLGHSVSWMSRVGGDSLSELVLSTLAANGVRALAQRDYDAPTGLTIKVRRTPEVSRINYYRKSSAAAHLSPADIPFEQIGAARLLHITGITPALGPGPAAAVRAAVDYARKNGVKVSMDINYRAALWSREEAAAALSDLVCLSDVIFASPHEAELFTSALDLEELVANLSRLGPSEVVVKLGKDGAIGLIDGKILRQPAYPATEVDPVGAGDAFVAGYLSELLREMPSTVRLDTAARAGALAVMVDGDWEGLPYRSELTLLEAPHDVLR